MRANAIISAVVCLLGLAACGGSRAHLTSTAHGRLPGPPGASASVTSSALTPAPSARPTTSPRSTTSPHPATSPSPPVAPEARPVVAALQAFLDALAGGDTRAACSHLTAHQAAVLVQIGKLTGLRATSCEAVLASSGQRLTSSTRRFLRTAQISHVHVMGDAATASVRGSPHVVRLVRRSGGWLIAAGIGR